LTYHHEELCAAILKAPGLCLILIQGQGTPQGGLAGGTATGGEEGAVVGGGGTAHPSGIIKSGYLKKANHHSMGTIWKTKMVEIHPGLFVYEDDDNILGKR
jgi:hypothetical protein